MSVKTFDLGDLLCFTTGALVSDRHIDGIYDVAEHMTGQPVMTHQLLIIYSPCRDEIIRQFPFLEGIEFPYDEIATIPDEDRESFCKNWVNEVANDLGQREFQVFPMGAPPDCSTPLADLIEMTRPDQQILVVHPDIVSD